MADLLDPLLLVPIKKIARFIETGDVRLLSAFADQNVVIIENFPPHLFQGEDAVARWSKVILSWHTQIDDLVLEHSFGPAQDLTIGEDIAFLSLPTHWKGLRNRIRFHEDGGWAFVLVRQNDEWRVRCYGWAVTNVVEV